MIKKCFLTGLATLLPLAVTVAVVVFCVNLLTKPFLGFASQFLTHLLSLGGWNYSDQVIRNLSQLLILIGIFLFILILGVVARWVFFNAILHIGDRILHKIPLVNTVYKSAKEIIHTLFASDKKSFQQVVMLPFPYPGGFVLGLITREAPETCEQTIGDGEMVSIFLPTTPNPTTGFLVVRPKSDLIHLDMRSEDAIKYIVSCGVVLPESHEEL